MTVPTEQLGKVVLVGAGPGDPDLITVRGANCLRRAEVVVYDYLVPKALLDYLPAGAERIFAGKKAGTHYSTQDEINALLIREAEAGKYVVRLKGGDPFTFGRGGEECLALARAGVPFEVVPGVTAAAGAAAYAGIPLTHRDYASAVTFVTAHRRARNIDLAIDWAHLAATTDTLVFFMGMRLLPEICAQLQRHGRPAETPVAVVQWATLPEQRTVTGTLADIAPRAAKARIGTPGLIIVGDAVALQRQLAWFEGGC